MKGEQMAEDPKVGRCGFVAVLGRTNVGKSTLVNGLVGEKVAIVTPKPQTTRNVVRGIYNEQRGQIIFLDTPGLHKPRTRMNQAMVRTALGSVEGVDAVLWLIHAAQPWHEEEDQLAKVMGSLGKPLVVVLNQVDTQPDKAALLPLMQDLSARFPSAPIYPMCALDSRDYPKLVDLLFEVLPLGGPLFPPEVYTDQMERQLAAEVVREQVFLRTREEVPHCTGVLVESFQEPEEEGAQVEIHCAILVERESQKPILIGKGGQNLKEIGTRARLELQRLLGCRVDLRLWVKVRPGWRDHIGTLQEMGLA
jgi:GTP-binding protein Era